MRRGENSKRGERSTMRRRREQQGGRGPLCAEGEPQRRRGPLCATCLPLSQRGAPLCATCLPFLRVLHPGYTSWYTPLLYPGYTSWYTPLLHTLRYTRRGTMVGYVHPEVHQEGIYWAICLPRVYQEGYTGLYASLGCTRRGIYRAICLPTTPRVYLPICTLVIP